MKTLNLKRPPKHQEVSRLIRLAIMNREFKSGDKIPSENDLVTAYGISRPTVREAVSTLVSEGLLAKHHGKGCFVQDRKINDLAFVICGRNYADPLFSMILKGAQSRISELKGRLIFHDCKNSNDISRLEEGFYGNGAVKGIIATGILRLKHLNKLMEINRNLVLVGDIVSRKRTPDIVTRIVSDNYDASVCAVNHLIRLGHRNIAHVTGDLNRIWFIEPYEAYKRCLGENGMKLNPEYLIECEEEGVEYGKNALEKLAGLRHRPTAIFCANDRFAWGVAAKAREYRMRIPEDISVIGMGDLSIGDSQDFLTTMRCYPEKSGYLAVDKIYEGVCGKTEKIVIPMSLIERKSCAPPPS
jgi:LacI family transcriptional regulator